MTREIKFRYVFMHHETNEVRTVIITIDDMEQNNWGDISDWQDDGYYLVSRDQFIGSKDRNGKDIYDGDLADGEHGTYLVKWDEQKAQFIVQVIKSKYVLIRQISFPLWQYVGNAGKCRFKVIGNIYENPDLLEVSK